MATRGYDIPGPWDAEYVVAQDWKVRYDAECKALAELQAISDEATVDDPKGYILSFPVADGQALYQVEKVRPLRLCHIPFLDGYQIPDAHLRGLNLDDVKQQIRFRDRWNAMAVKNAGAE